MLCRAFNPHLCIALADGVFFSADNVGLNAHLVHKDTIESVVAAFPRKGWSGCFAETMREEMRLKPWCHTTANEGFVEAVLGNELMEPYDTEPVGFRGAGTEEPCSTSLLATAGSATLRVPVR